MYNENNRDWFVPHRLLSKIVKLLIGGNVILSEDVVAKVLEPLWLLLEAEN
jgi:hypothetical protein